MITTDDLNVIEGFVAKDESFNNRLFFFCPYKPKRNRFQGIWQAKGREYEIPREIFPNLKWEDEPIKVELTIKRI